MLNVSVFFLKSLVRDTFLWFLQWSCYMDEFFVMKICPLKGQVYNLP